MPIKIHQVAALQDFAFENAGIDFSTLQTGGSALLDMASAILVLACDAASTVDQLSDQGEARDFNRIVLIVVTAGNIKSR